MRSLREIKRGFYRQIVFTIKILNNLWEVVIHKYAGPGGRVLTPNFGRYVPRQSENGGLRGELERESGGLRNWLYIVGRVWLEF